ncbi:MAG: hypothetical protein K1X51_12075 [Rhodospirillaceae bacterium]|nr:hypothetical protein [Rhodospirillaceae bacterium]
MCPDGGGNHPSTVACHTRRDETYAKTDKVIGEAVEAVLINGKAAPLDGKSAGAGAYPRTIARTALRSRSGPLR